VAHLIKTTTRYVHFHTQQSRTQPAHTHTRTHVSFTALYPAQNGWASTRHEFWVLVERHCGIGWGRSAGTVKKIEIQKATEAPDVTKMRETGSGYFLYSRRRSLGEHHEISEHCLGQSGN